MKHSASGSFWDAYNTLPLPVRVVADRNFALLKDNAKHPSLHLKQTGRFWSVRAGIHYRALGVSAPDGIIWIWIGTHAAYDRLIQAQK